MTEADDKISPPAVQTVLETAKGKRSTWPRILLFTLVFLLVAGALAAFLWLQPQGFLMPASMHATGAAQKIAALALKVETLDARVTDLAARVDGIAATASPPSSADLTRASKTSAPDLTRIQDDLATLTTTVNSLQAEAASARAESVAFMQLREAAISGHSFARELKAFQEAASNDSGLKNLSDKLTPFAGNGAPAMLQLREQFTEQMAAADQAIDKANAQNWWQRVLAELKRMVSVRPLHGPASANVTLDAVQVALARDDPAAALEDIKILPPEAKQALAGWRQNVETRLTIDEALRGLADRLIAGAKAAAPTQDAP